MKEVKILVLGGIFTGFAVLFQIIPALFSELLAILTIFSALPIYIMSRIKPVLGFSTFLSASILVFIISPHEGLLFIFTNGIVGLSLGLCKHYFNHSLSCIFVSSLSLAASIGILNFLLGINVLVVKFYYSVDVLLVIYLAFSIVYCTVYYNFTNLVYTLIRRILPHFIL